LHLISRTKLGSNEKIFLLQRFKCFGDLDAPDWILAEITVLAKLVSYEYIFALSATMS
jgi:hypothetical protein